MIPRLSEKFIAHQRMARNGISLWGFMGLNSFLDRFSVENTPQSFFQLEVTQNPLVDGILSKKTTGSMPNSSILINSSVKVSYSMIYSLPSKGYFGFVSQRFPKNFNTKDVFEHKSLGVCLIVSLRRVLRGLLAFFGTNVVWVHDSPIFSSHAGIVDHAEQFSISSI